MRSDLDGLDRIGRARAWGSSKTRGHEHWAVCAVREDGLLYTDEDTRAHPHTPTETTEVILLTFSSCRSTTQVTYGKLPPLPYLSLSPFPSGTWNGQNPLPPPPGGDMTTYIYL